MGKFEIALKPDQEFITLQSVLQVGDVISTGGMAKAFLEQEKVLVNGEEENRRGRKLRDGDLVEIKSLKKSFLIVKS